MAAHAGGASQLHTPHASQHQLIDQADAIADQASCQDASCAYCVSMSSSSNLSLPCGFISNYTFYHFISVADSPEKELRPPRTFYA